MAAKEGFPPLAEYTGEYMGARQVSHYHGGTPSVKTLQNYASQGGPIMPDKKQAGRNLYKTAKIKAALLGEIS